MWKTVHITWEWEALMITRCGIHGGGDWLSQLNKEQIFPRTKKQQSQETNNKVENYLLHGFSKSKKKNNPIEK